MSDLSNPTAKTEIGVGGRNTRNGTIRADEFLPELRGTRAIKAYREMRDNDPTIGAVMYATEQVLRDVPYKIEVPKDLPEGKQTQAEEKAKWLETVLNDMDHTLDDHISEALSSLSFGFSIFEVVYKVRSGPKQPSKKKRSKYSDGTIGVRKLASRAQWTIQKFDIDQQSGDVLAIVQDGNLSIPYNKVLHYKTTNTNEDPSGRSILRNAYTAYTRLKGIQSIEAIAIEREFAGIPVGRIPADYLSPDATDAQKSLRGQFEDFLRDVRLNEQGYLLLPSDLQQDGQGSFAGGNGAYIMDVSLISSNGTRNIDIDPVIKRYQHDIARSVMAEFLMLGGSGSTGSYALSKSKTDLFLRSMESYINSIFDVINKQLIEPLWRINGFDVEIMPRIIPGDVAPHDLKEIAAFLRNVNGSGIEVADQPELVKDLFETADLDFDSDLYEKNREEAKKIADEIHQSAMNPQQQGNNPQNGKQNGNL